MSERMVLVIEYDMCTDSQQALNDAMTQIKEGADRLDPNRVKVVGVHVGVEDFVDRVLALFDKKPEAPSNPPSSPVETTGAPARPIPPESLNGHTGAAYTDVIRRPEMPVTREDRYISAMWACDEDFMAAVYEVMALADAEMADLNAMHTAVTAEADMAEAALKAERVISRSKDATIERLWAQLNDATNVPDHQCSLNDPKCDGTYCTDALQAADDRRAL